MARTQQLNDGGTSPSMLRAGRRVGWWLLLVVAIVLGSVIAVGVLLTAVAVTGSRVPGAVAGALAIVVCTGGLSWLAARRIFTSPRPRRWLPIGVTAITLAVVATVIGLVLFAPTPAPTPFEVTADTRYWDLPTGSRIAYTHIPAKGAPTATPVILVHGGPGAPDGAQDLLTSTLAEAGFDVYDYHQVGAGLSSRLTDVGAYTVARHVADLEAIRAAIGADRVVLVGASWGGKLIASYLAAHPDHVAKAVVSSPAPIWSPAFAATDGLTASGRQDQQAVIEGFPRFMLAHALMRTVGPELARGLLPDGTMDGIFQDIIGRLDMWSGCPDERREARAAAGGEPAGVGFWVNAATSFDAERIADPRPLLRAVSTPVLVLRSECDYLAWEATREYRDLLPNAVLLAIEAAGHVIPEDQPELYRQLVRAFLLDEPLPQEAYTADVAPW